MASNMRIGGLATGMDIDTLVKDAMKVERNRKVRTTEIRQQQDKWRVEDYNQVSTDIATFIKDIRSDFGINNANSTSSFLTTSTKSFNWVNEASSSDTTVMTASANVEALKGSYSIEVTDVASKAVRISSTKTTVEGGDTSSMFKQFNITGEISFEIETNNGIKAFQFYESDTLDEVVTAINDADIGVKAYYDEDADMFYLNTEETGNENYFKIVSDNQNLFKDHLNINVDIGTEYSGTDLSMTLAGNTITNSSNSVSVYGIDLDIKGTGQTTVAVSTDVDGFYSKIESFVKKYNTMISSINSKTNESVDRDYDPLTSDQKEALSDDEQELWTAKARSGMLRNDSILENYVSRLRTDAYATVYKSYSSSTVNEKGTYSQLTEIGISTGSYQDKGKLQIDESKLKEALREDPKAVIDMLFASPEDSYYNQDDAQLTEVEKEKKYNESGLFNKMFNTTVNSLKSIVSKSGAGKDPSVLREVKFNILIDFVTKEEGISRLGKNIIDYASEISDKEDLLTRIETRLWAQYTRMETSINTMNQQSAWLSQQLG